jgi:hypothetical protein
MTVRRLAFAVVLLLICAVRAHATLVFQNPLDGAVITDPNGITIQGTHTGASQVFLQIQQDPTLLPPPNGIGGATLPVSTTLNGNQWFTVPLHFLNGNYRLIVQSNVDFPVTIDITVAIPNNPGFVDCWSNPALQGVQTKTVTWDPGLQPPNAPSLNVNMSRSSTAGDPELNTSPTFYPVGTTFVCTQPTGGRVPRMLIFGADPVIDVNNGFVGWAYDSNGKTLTAKMQTVSGNPPIGPPVNSMIAGLFALYDDDPKTPGLLPNLTGSWFAANAQFSLTQVTDANLKTKALTMTVIGPKNDIAFFKAFFPTNVLKTFFGPTCADIPDPTIVQPTSLVGSVLKTAVGNLGCEMSLEVMFHSPVSITIPVVPLAPVVTVPQPITAEATSAAGAVVTFTASATGVDGAEPVTCTPSSGSTFPLDLTVVHCVATDSFGGSSAASFDVTVVDTTPPSLVVPQGINVYTASPNGTNVSFTVTASDLVDPSPIVTCNPASGSLFPIGTTMVNCTATDAHNNSAQDSFHVSVGRLGRIVVDWRPLVWPLPFKLPVSVGIEAASSSGTPMSYEATTEDGRPVSCSPASGSTFAIGRTVITCSTTDIDGSPLSTTVDLIVADRRAPTLFVPGPSLPLHRWTLGPDPTPFAGATDLSSFVVVDSGFTTAPIPGAIDGNVVRGTRAVCAAGDIGGGRAGTLLFDGSSDAFVDLGGAFDHVGSANLELSIALNTSWSGRVPMTVLSNRSDAPTFIELTLQPSGAPRVEIGDPSGANLVLDGTASINDGAWHRVAVLRLGSDVTMFVDGAPAASGRTADTIALGSGAALHLGAGMQGAVGVLALRIPAASTSADNYQLATDDGDGSCQPLVGAKLTATGPDGAPLVFGPDPTPFGPDPSPFLGPDPTPILPTSIDAVDGRPVVICQANGQAVQSGSVMPVGNTLVTCAATDIAGNTAADSFIVSVTAPSVAPKVRSFAPHKGIAGDRVTINGLHLANVTGVVFGGNTAAAFTVVSDVQIVAVVPTGALTGPVTVTTAGGSAATAHPFKVAPVVGGFAPASAIVGAQVTITGSGFTGATSVTFHTLAAAFSVVADGVIVATVPSGATDGPIHVVTPSGTAVSRTAFDAIVPTITSFTPHKGAVGDVVTINGKDLDSTTAVTFAGAAPVAPTSVSATQVQAIVPAGAIAGPIALTTIAGGVSTKTDYAIVPTLNDVNPKTAARGATVTLTGSGFTAVTGVTVGSIAATFTIVDDGTIQMTVPLSATTAKVHVLSPAGNAVSATSLVVTR